MTLILLLSTCITNQKDACKNEIAIDGKDMQTCIDGLLGVAVVISIADNEDEVKSRTDFLNYYVLPQCIISIREENKCNKKSEYLPGVYF